MTATSATQKSYRQYRCSDFIASTRPDAAGLFRHKLFSASGLPFGLLLLTLCCLCFDALAQAREQDLVPDEKFQPEDVVQIVVDSLQTNDEAKDDNGIATVFRFASPGNRAQTGPLSRFTQMIKRGFPDMLNHAGARYDPIKISGDTAVQAVWLLTDSGTEVGYGFQLGKQQLGEYKGMWMTEAVVPLGDSGTGI